MIVKSVSKNFLFCCKKPGITTEIGNPFHQNTLKNIIKNPKYKGFYTGGLSTVIDFRSKKRNFNKQTDWKLYQDYEKVPPIVSEALWEKANQKLLSRSKKSNTYQKCQMQYPLSGKLYCEKHKCGFVRKIRHYKKKTDDVYWYCANFHKTGKKNCITSCLKQQEVYCAILSVLTPIFKMYQQEICKDLLSLYSETPKLDKSKEQKKLLNELSALNQKQDKLLDLALEGSYPKEQLTSKNEMIEQQKKDIMLQLKDLKAVTQNESQSLPYLKKQILKELEITNENIEIYIENIVEKITIIENTDVSGKPSKNSELNIELSGHTIKNISIFKN